MQQLNRGTLMMEYYAMFLISLLILENYSQVANAYIQPLVLPLGCLFTGLLLLTSRVSLQPILVWLVFAIAGGMNIAFVGNLGLFYLTRTLLVHFPIALFFVQEKFVARRLWKYFLLAFLLFFTIVWSKSDGIQFFYQSSRNYVSIYIISVLCLYGIYLSQRNQELPVYFFVYAFVMSTWAVGRGGIIATGSMLVLYFIYSFITTRKNSIYFIMLVFLVVLLIYFLLFANIESYFSRFFDSYSARSDMIRTNLLTYYWRFTKSSYYTLFFGSRLSSIYGLVTNNLHNSYAQVHSYYGALGLISMFLWLANSARFLIKNKAYILLILLIGFLIRAATDSMFIAGYFDIILFYYILLPYRLKLDVKYFPVM